MAIDFPASPTNGQTFTSGNTTYTWDGVKWTATVAGTTPVKIEVSNTKAEVLDTGSDGRFVVTTEGSERLRVTSAGLVGIGTNSPSSILQCSGGASGTDTRINVGNAATTLGIGVDTANDCFIGTTQSEPLYFFTAGVQRLYISSAGNVGIGTSTPGAELSVVGDIRSTGSFNTSASNYIYSYGGGAAGAVRSGFYLDGTNTVLSFFTAQNERARIDSSGRLLVGTSSQISSSTARLQVAGQILATGQISALPAVNWTQTVGNPATDGILTNLERGKIYLISVFTQSGALAVTPRMALYMVAGNGGTTGGLAAFAIGGDTGAFTVTAENVSTSFFNVRIAVLDSSRVFGVATATCVIG